jgi:hypothetical protein
LRNKYVNAWKRKNGVQTDNQFLRSLRKIKGKRAEGKKRMKQRDELKSSKKRMLTVGGKNTN